MINSTQLRNCIVRPVLKKIGMWSQAAEELMMGTAAQETMGGTYIIQEERFGIYTKGGLGIYEMQALTHDDLWADHITIKPDLLNSIMAACNFRDKPDSYELVWNLQYATIMTRIFYHAIEKPLPEPDDIEGLANYWKTYYNTKEGAGTVEEFIRNYRGYVGIIS